MRNPIPSPREYFLWRVKFFGAAILAMWITLMVMRYLPAPRDISFIPLWAAGLLVLVANMVAFIGSFIFSLAIWFMPVKTIDQVIALLRSE